MLETVKIYGYSRTGTVMMGAGYVPLAIGTGLVTIGERMIDCGVWLQSKGVDCKLYSVGLDMLEKGLLDKAFVEQEAKSKGIKFSAALREIAKQRIEQDQSVQQATVQQQQTSVSNPKATVAEEAEATVVKAEESLKTVVPVVKTENKPKVATPVDEEDNVSAAIAAAATLV